MSYETSPKRSSHRAALYKGRSPNWRESLKSKCRQEIHLRRQSMLNRMRDLSVEEMDDSSMLDDILYTQFVALRRQLQFSDGIDVSESTDDIQVVIDEIKQELLFEQASHDLGDMFYEDMAKTQFNESVICPMCQKNNLFKLHSSISCVCGVQIIKRGNVELEQVRSALSTAADLHSASCGQAPLFSIETEDEYSELSMQCNFCKFFYRVV